MIGMAVLGAGYWGPNLIRNLLDTPGVDVRVCVDPDARRQNFIKKRFPSVEVRGTYQQLLSDPMIDAVAIATPLHTHYDLTKAFLKAGKHVQVEKPVVNNLNHARELIDIAHKNGLVLQAGHTFLYSGAVEYMKDFIDKGEIGDLQYFESTRVNLGLVRNDTNVIWDLAPHDLSILFYLVNPTIREVKSVGLTRPETSLDTCYTTLKFVNGAIGFINIGWRAPVKVRKMVIGGSKRMIVYDDTEPIEKVKVFDSGIDWVEEETTGLLERQLIYRTGDILVPKLVTAEPLLTECRKFVECIKTGSPSRTGEDQILKVTEALCLIEESLTVGGLRT